MIEENIQQKVQNYLLELGYALAALKFEVSLELGQHVDLIVFDEEQPFIVIEFRLKDKFISIDDPTQFRFHPHVRQLQSIAISLRAPYFVITDGETFNWFKTDESGRPYLLKEPIRSERNPTIALTSQTNRNDIYSVFVNLKDLLYRKSIIDRSDEAATLILAKLLSERGNQQLREILLSDTESNEQVIPINTLNIKTKTLLNHRVVKDAFWILDRITLTKTTPIDVLNAIDEVFFHAYKGREFRVNRWLADFLVHLGQLDKSSILLDIFSSFGDILAAAWLQSEHPSSVWGMSSTSEGAIWAKIQQLVIGEDAHTIFEGNSLSYNSILKDTSLFSNHNNSIPVPTPSHIISAPSFGQRIYDIDSSFQLWQHGSVQAEDLFIELAINWVKPDGRIVILVSEGLLFGSNRRYTRRLIKNKTRIVGIISLPSGALLPYSNIKSSILILDKKDVLDSSHIFMSEIEEFDSSSSFDCKNISAINTVLNDFKCWTTQKQVPTNENSWLIPNEEIQTDNFTVNYYKPNKEIEMIETSPHYNIVQLKQIVKLIKRGKAIKLNSDGVIRVIGPAAIRPMNLEVSRLDLTSEDKLHPKVFTVEIGDVVINSISTHLGSAAAVNMDVAGAFISQHAILIRPDSSIVLPEYLAIALNSNYVKPQILQRATGSIMPSLSSTRLEDIKIPLPPLDIQKQIIEKVEQARNTLSRAEEVFRKAEANFTNSFQKLFS
jgi:hypothetical protein